MKSKMENQYGSAKNKSGLALGRATMSGLALLAVPVIFVGCTGSGGSGGSGGTGMASNNTSTTIATVDGTNISRADLQAFTEAMSGEEALQQLIDYELLMKDLKSKSLEVSDAEVTAAIAKQRQSMGPDNVKRFDALLQSDAPQAEAFRRQAKRRLAIQKILTKDIKVNEADFKKWFDKNKDTRYPMHFSVGILLSSQKARADAMERQLTTKAKTFKNLVEEQKKLNDPLAKQSTEDSQGQAPMTINMVPKNMGDAIKATKPGDITKVVTLGNGQPGTPAAYAIVRVIDKKEASFEAMRDEAEMDYKLEQLARQDFKKTSPTGKFEDAVAQLRQSLGQQAMQMAMQTGQMAPPPTEADAINYMTRSSETKLLGDLRQGGKVQVADTTYQSVGDLYKPASIAPVSVAPSGGSAPAPSAPASGAKTP